MFREILSAATKRFGQGAVLGAGFSLFFFIYAFLNWLDPKYYNSTFNFLEAFKVSAVLIGGFGIYGALVLPLEMAAGPPD